MDKEKYISALDDAIKKAGYGNRYASKCIQYATRLIDNGLPVIFDTKHLALLIGISAADLCKMLFSEARFYTRKRIPKKRGGTRELDMPSYDLKYIQRWILDQVLYRMNVSEFAYGFQIGKSIVDNARIHVNNHCIVNLDISDFFPTISFENVFRIFAYYGYTKEVSFVLAKLCTFEGKLPQGSPASPYISNICCLKLDARLSTLAKVYESNYSRYADDITFSSQRDIKKIVNVARGIIESEGFKINEKKCRVAYSHQRQEVTGLIVNGLDIHVSKKYKKDLSQELYYCQKFGVANHLQHIGCDKAFFKEHIYGKIYFVNMVEPKLAKKLLVLADTIDWNY